MTNKEKFLALVSQTDHSTLEQVGWRIKNREMLRESQKIALKILTRLDELNWTQKDLAREMEVSPQQVNKIVSGKENLGLGTQIKLQNILDIPILASYYEDKMKKAEGKYTIYGDKKHTYDSYWEGNQILAYKTSDNTVLGCVKHLEIVHNNINKNEALAS